MTTSSTLASIQDNPSEHRFEYASQGERAVTIYALAGNVITFLHTRVPEALRGQGVATQLVLASLASARERGLRVIPQCPVFAAYMRAHPETHDLLADEGCALLGL
ncbi:GNAT family N-acetyltransferase [Polaromonas jejuensis]|uniref:GNAT family N-acetyltransferase n=1 Tax=Polaromonas jejuensis TaxID=457502 RepID=A0ABW0Q7W1_9BURK|nr:GNAT family N-acetyltransferase [Polaromonas jejuensis]